MRARPSPPDDVTERETERHLRDEVRRLLEDASYPATRNGLLRHIGPDERGQVHAHLRTGRAVWLCQAAAAQQGARHAAQVAGWLRSARARRRGAAATAV